MLHTKIEFTCDLRAWHFALLSFFHVPGISEMEGAGMCPEPGPAVSMAADLTAHLARHKLLSMGSESAAGSLSFWNGQLSTPQPSESGVAVRVTEMSRISEHIRETTITLQLNRRNRSNRADHRWRRFPKELRMVLPDQPCGSRSCESAKCFGKGTMQKPSQRQN